MVGKIRPKHRKSKASEKDVLSGKTITVNSRGIENFEDYFTKSEIDDADLTNSKSKSVLDSHNDKPGSLNPELDPNELGLNSSNSKNRFLKPKRPRHRAKSNSKGHDLNQGKVIRVDKNGKEVFEDYFSVSETGVNGDSNNIVQSDHLDNDDAKNNSKNSVAESNSVVKASSSTQSTSSFSKSTKKLSYHASLYVSNDTSPKRIKASPNHAESTHNVNEENVSIKNRDKSSRKTKSPLKQNEISETEVSLIKIPSLDSNETEQGIPAKNLSKPNQKKKKGVKRPLLKTNPKTKIVTTAADSSEIVKEPSSPMKKRKIMQFERDCLSPDSALHLRKSLKNQSQSSNNDVSVAPNHQNSEAAVVHETPVISKILEKIVIKTPKTSWVKKRLTVNLSNDISLDNRVSGTVNMTEANEKVDNPESTSDNKDDSPKSNSDKVPNPKMKKLANNLNECHVAIKDLCNNKGFVDAANNCSVSINGNVPNEDDCDRETASHKQTSEDKDVTKLKNTPTTSKASRKTKDPVTIPDKVEKPRKTASSHKQTSEDKDVTKLNNTPTKSKTSKKTKGVEKPRKKLSDRKSLNVTPEMGTPKNATSKKGSARSKTGGKHFPQKLNITKRSKRLQSKAEQTKQVSDSESEASESDGNIYITKSAMPNKKTLDVPSTSGWKPSIRKKGKKVTKDQSINKPPEPEKQKSTFNHKPTEKIQLSTITELDEPTTTHTNFLEQLKVLNPAPKIDPNRELRVSLLKLNLKCNPTTPPTPVMEKNPETKKRRSSLKGSRKSKSRLSVSFNIPRSQSNIVDNNQQDTNSNSLFENSRFLPWPTPENNTPNCRRSIRKRIPRLDPFLNQRIIYKYGPTGNLAIAGIDLGATNEKKRLPRKNTVPKRKPRDLDKSLSIHHKSALPDDSNETDNVPQGCDFLIKKESLRWFGPSSEENNINFEGISPAKDEDPYIFAKYFQRDNFSSGVIRLRGYSEKPLASTSVNQQLIFIVNYGKVLVEIHESKMIVETGDSFIVPAGNSYTFKNLRDDEATLVFYATV